MPFHAENGALPPRVLAGLGNEQRGAHGRHECKLSLAVKNIEPPYASHSTMIRLAELAGFARIKPGSLQITGIVERYRKTMLDAFHSKKIHATIGEAEGSRCLGERQAIPRRR